MKPKVVLRKCVTVLKYFFVFYPVYALSFLTPRKKNRWIFGSGYNFAENPKYLYLEIMANNPEIEAIWIARTREQFQQLDALGLRVAYIWSLRGICYLFTAKVYVSYSHLFESIFFWSLGRAKHINLWHGVPLKNIGFSVQSGRNVKKYHHPILKYVYKIFLAHLNRKPDLFLSTSGVMTAYFKKSFRLPDSALCEADYPRCMVFNWGEEKLRSHINTFEPEQTQELLRTIDGYDRVYAYMPTWRDGKPDFLGGASINYQELNDFCARNNTVFLFKVHPKTPIYQLDQVRGYSNILLLAGKMDFYPILPFVDLLVTDYSSVYFDFMHVQEGRMVFFPFDYDEYVARDRDLAFDYNKNTPGVRVNSYAELMECLACESYKAFDYGKRADLFERFWGLSQDKKNLLEQIKKIAGM